MFPVGQREKIALICSFYEDQIKAEQMLLFALRTNNRALVDDGGNIDDGFVKAELCMYERRKKLGVRHSINILECHLEEYVECRVWLGPDLNFDRTEFLDCQYHGSDLDDWYGNNNNWY